MLRHVCNLDAPQHNFDALIHLAQGLADRALIALPTLARDPTEVSAYEVIRAIDGPLFITACITVRGECDQTERCTIREPLRKVNESIEEVLRRIKIAEMTEANEGAGSVSVKALAQLVNLS